MKLLTIVRHAKSSWGSIDISDHNRTLKDIGVTKTKKIVEFLKKEEIIPDLILSSSAVRAVNTATIIAQGLGYDTDELLIKKSLYHSDADDIFDEIFSISNSVESLMIIGHNPTLTDFVNEFVDPFIENLPTSGTVCVEFDTNKWEKISNANFKVRFVIFPKMLI